jgi:hypothetical protein
VIKRFLLSLLVLLLVVSSFISAPAYAAGSDDKFEAAVEAQVQAIQAKHGTPAIVNGRDYLTTKEMYEYRDRANFATFSYLQDNRGKFHCAGLSVGYPMPASVQISNPRKYVQSSSSYGILTLPQAEPNGLFMPDGLSATYQKIINPNTGEVSLGYFEDDLIVLPYELPNAATSCAAFQPKQ